MDEEFMDGLLRRWAESRGMTPQDFRDWNAPGRGIRMGGDFGEPVRHQTAGAGSSPPRGPDKPPRGSYVGRWSGSMYKPGTGMRNTKPTSIKSWLRKLLGRGAGRSLGILGLGIPDELAAGTVEDYFGDTGDLSDEEMMAYYNALIDLGN